MKMATDKYAEFLELRKKVISDIASLSIYKEERDGEPVRPVAIILTESELKHFQEYIGKWSSFVSELVSEDPVRYPASAIKFNPKPQIFFDIKKLAVTENTAVHSEKYPKARIIARMEKYINHLETTAENTGDTNLLRRVKAELDNMLADNEEFYRRRTTGNTEVICLVTRADMVTEKIRVPYAGVIFYDPTRELEIREPRKLQPRADSFEFLSVRPIPCSLSSLSGYLYRESELMRAKAEYQARKNR